MDQKPTAKHRHFSHFFTFLAQMRSRFVYRIFLSYLSIFVGLILITVMINSYQMSNREMTQGTYTGTKALNQATAYLQYRVQEINNIISAVSYSNTVKQALRDGELYYSHSTANWNISTSQGIKKIQYGSYTSRDISSIRLYSIEGTLSFEETEKFQQLSSQKQEEWHSRLETVKGDHIWIPGSFFAEDHKNSSVLLVNKIASLDNLSKNLGYIISTIPEGIFEELIDQAATTQNTSVILFNTHNEIIAKNDTCPDSLTPKRFLTLLPDDSGKKEDNLQEVTFRQSVYLAGLRNIENTDWTIGMLVPAEDILASSHIFTRQMLWYVMVVFLMSLPIIFLIGRALSSRIVSLKQKMHDFSHGQTVEYVPDPGNDEISDLTNSFYHMQNHIQELMQEQYLQGSEIKNLELQVLQSQINPHFLYNTLDMIYWMGINNNTPDVAEAVQALGEFYKLSLGRGEKIVTLEDEIRHVETYVAIQNMRFNNRIAFYNDIPLSLYAYRIIKITLQPLIENAINHGIREKASESGSIALTASKEGSLLCIYIQDDGVGMTPEQLENVLKKRTHSSGHGYGVWNINERIKLTFGQEYGLCYFSTPGQGTCVEIRLPAILEE